MPGLTSLCAFALHHGYVTDAVVSAYSELFDRMDLDNDGYLNKSELDQYMMRTEGAPVQETAFQWLLHKFEGKEG
jgi:Ca2+-binding EF-hand superfamily protein